MDGPVRDACPFGGFDVMVGEFGREYRNVIMK